MNEWAESRLALFLRRSCYYTAVHDALCNPALSSAQLVIVLFRIIPLITERTDDQ